MMKAIHTLFRPLVLMLATALAVTLASCGGGSSGDGAAASGQTGSVAVLFTDGPSADFDEINLTVTRIELIGEDGARAEVFAGERTVNLLDLRNNSDIFSLVDVRADVYHKIRLTVTGLELVRYGDPDNEVIEPRLPANGKIDLNPRGEFVVSPDEALILQLDVDADKSLEKNIHVVGRGDGAYNFRPVVFVDIISGAASGKFVKLSGTVELDDAAGPGVYRLCKTDVEFDGDHDGDGDLDDGESAEGTEDEAFEDDDADDTGFDDDFEGEGFDGDRRCLDLELTEDTSVFDAEGAAAAADIMDGDIATVVGRLQRTGDGVILTALAVELGLSGTFSDVEGTVVAAYDGATGAFEIEVTESDDIAAGERIAVELLEGARVMSRSGVMLAPEDIGEGLEVEIEGLLTGGTPAVQASVVFLDHEGAGDEHRLSGSVSLDATSTGDFMLLGTARGDVCVRLEGDAEVFEVSTGAEGLSSEAIGPFGLSDGQQADVYGHMHSFGCFEADDVIVAAASP